MGASTAPAAVVETPAPAPPRGLWQIPLFVAGVGALVGVCLTRPLLAARDPALALRHELAEVRRVLDRPNGDLALATQLAEHVLAEKDQHPETAGEADLLLGTVLMRQAARAEPAQAAKLWADAGRHLEDAEKETVPPNERGRLQYRLGVVGLHTWQTQEDLRRAITRIKPAIDMADDPVDGYTLLTQAYLKLDKPDVQEALAANLKLRNLPQAKEDILPAARLLGGELELRLGHTEQARKVLRNLGPQATPDLQARARRLCARSLQDESRWPDAAALWQEALADGAQTGEVLYNLGICAQRQGQNADAARFWDQCVKAGGDEGQAAAMALAELRFKGPNPETALEMFAVLVDKVKPGDEWTNPLVDRAAAVKLFQDASKTYMDSRHFDLAVRLAEPFARAAAAGEADVLRAKASAEWARVRQDEARQAAAPEAKKAAEDAARDLFRQAAAAYEAAADRAAPTAEPGEYLWQSARCSWEGKDQERAAAGLEKVLQLGVGEEQKKDDWYQRRQGEAWYLLGETRRGLKDVEGANTAYRECMKYPTTFAYRARYYLAQAAMARGDKDEAVEALERNLKQLRTDPEPEAYEKSLFALGELYYLRGDYGSVVQRLGTALNRFPANPEATRAHYELADSYRRLADQSSLDASLGGEGLKGEEARKAALERHTMYLTNAAEEFKKLAELLDAPEGQGLLKPEDELQVPFFYADCLFYLGEYGDALQKYEALARRYADRPESLNALGGMVRCYFGLGETDKMQQRLADIDALLPKLPPEVRQKWSEWLTVARKPTAVP